MKPTVYTLDIFRPQSRESVWRSFESSTPFMAISEGDVVDPSAWSGSHSPIRVLRVIQVNHVLSERDEQPEHKIEVFTEEIMAYQLSEEEE